MKALIKTTIATIFATMLMAIPAFAATVTFDQGSGTWDSSLAPNIDVNGHYYASTTTGDKVAAPDVDKLQFPDGAAHVRWKNGDAIWDFDTDTTTLDLTLTAEYYNTVTFDANGGTPASTAVNVVAGQSIPAASVPAITKPTGTEALKGWYKDPYTVVDSNKWNFSDTVTQDMTLKAIYDVKVTYDANGGTLTDASTITTYKGGKIPKPSNPTAPTGKIFTEWRVGDTATVWNFDDPVNENTTLKAYYSSLYNVTFNLNGGYIGSDYSDIVKQVAPNTAVTTPGTPLKDGYKFKYWLKNGTPYNMSSPVTESFTLTAGYAPVFRVKFDSDGGSKVKTQEVIENGKVKEPDDPKKDGYKFVKWVTSGSSDAYDFDEPVTESFTLKAVWEASSSSSSSMWTNSSSTSPMLPMSNLTGMTGGDGTALANGAIQTGDHHGIWLMLLIVAGIGIGITIYEAYTEKKAKQ